MRKWRDKGEAKVERGERRPQAGLPQSQITTELEQLHNFYCLCKTLLDDFYLYFSVH